MFKDAKNIYILNNEKQLDLIQYSQSDIVFIISKTERIEKNIYYVSSKTAQKTLQSFNIPYRKLPIHIKKPSIGETLPFPTGKSIITWGIYFIPTKKKTTKKVPLFKHFFDLDVEAHTNVPSKNNVPNTTMDYREQSMPKVKYKMASNKSESHFVKDITTEQIIDMLTQLTSSVDKMHQEMNSHFNTIINQLTDIQDSLFNRKNEYIREIQSALNEDPNNDFILEDIEGIRNQLDHELYEGTLNIIECEKFKPIVRISRYPYLYCFEETSKSMIESCLIVEKLIEKHHLIDFDYSLCSAGYWKAVEIELNIIIADTLRYLKNLIDHIPSEGYSKANNTVNIFAGYNYNKKNKYVNINKKDYNSGQLKSLMFGELLSILEYGNQNELKEFLLYIQNELSIISNYEIFLNSFVNDLKYIIYNYRNKYSHTGKMNKQQFEELKILLLDCDGILETISNLKSSAISIRQQ